MPSFPIRAGQVQLPADVPAQLGTVTIANTSASQTAAVTVTEDATGRVIVQTSLAPKGTYSLGGLNATDLLPGGTYTIAVQGNVTGTIDTH